MQELAGELGLPTFRTWNDEGQLLLDLQGKRSTMKPDKGAVPRLSPFALADLGQGLLRFARLAARTDLERPWLTPARRGARRADLRELDPPQPAHQGGTRLLPRRLRGGVGRRGQ